MAKFVIAPHMRLHEWIAVEKGYFDVVGLDYALENQLESATGKLHDLGDLSYDHAIVAPKLEDAAG